MIIIIIMETIMGTMDMMKTITIINSTIVTIIIITIINIEPILIIKKKKIFSIRFNKNIYLYFINFF
jgi:hypothetical protein